MKPSITLLFVICIITTHATTWDEPWQDKVVKESQSFILAKILSSNPAKGVTVAVIKLLEGLPVKDTITINQFYLLHICSSSSGEGPEFNFEQVDSCYFFLKKNDSAGYSISTPTSGFAVVRDGKVAATYRHSYHQTSVGTDVYEKTMAAIFNYYHNTAFDTSYINGFVTLQLSQKPAGFAKDELQTFFNQHAALELIYHLHLQGKYQLILPFLHSTNFHAQISAARALSWYNSSECHKELVGMIADSKIKDFAKVITIWALQGQHPAELKQQLIQLRDSASTDSNGFGGDIMDPRVCTHFPSVKNAIKELIDSL